MNEERKARVEDLAAELDGWIRADQEWLLALVKELDEEYGELSDRLDVERQYHDETRGYRQHAEQQLAAVTAERDELKRQVERLRHLQDAAIAEAEQLGLVRGTESLREWIGGYVATLKNRAEQAAADVERLRTGQSTMRTRIDVEMARAEKAEAERDALKDDIARLHEAIEEDARELARLKPPPPFVCDGTCSGDELGDCSHAIEARLKGGI